MNWIILAAAILLVVLPPFLKRKRPELNEKDTALLGEYKTRLKGKAFAKRPEDMTEDQRRLWSRAMSELKEKMSIRVYQAAGVVVAIIMVLVLINSR